MTPNWFATFALLSWPLVAIYLYRTRPVNQATLWTILGGWLLLPVGALIKFEMIPQFDKASIPNLAAVGCLLMVGRPPRFWNRFGATEILMLMLLIGPFITSELNTDILVIGNTILPASSHYDAVSAVVTGFIFWLPFLLGRQLLRSSADNAEILRVLVIAGLLYSLPILFEVRMSPQLHTWLYGYFPNPTPGSFAMEVRNGGFRPMVFLGHGLVVAFFAMTAAVAAAALWRTRTRVMRFAPAGVTAYLGVILVLCKGSGSLVFGAALVPLVRFTRPRLQARLATVLVSLALLYPMLRSADLIPAGFMIDTARVFSEERADSLKFRFDQEQQLLGHASERLLFGWGRFGRGRVYEQDSGQDVSVTDGHWIITMGTYGLFGFLAEFGLLALSVFRATSALKFTESMNDTAYLAALALIVAISVVDLLPNGFISPWTWLLAGALSGRADALLSVQRGRISRQNNRLSGSRISQHTVAP
jgi:hypothetical protein